MATIDDKNLIDKLIANNGFFEDDPQVALIVEYTNAWGNIAWGVTWSNQPAQDRYLQESEFVRNPRIIWQKGVN